MSVYENGQWRVLEDRIESIDPEHRLDIALERLFEASKHGENMLYDWPLAMVKEEWVDVWLFTDAFDQAIHHHAEATGQPVDEDMLFRTKQQAFLAEQKRPAKA